MTAGPELAPGAATTLVDLLQARASKHAQQRAYTFLVDGEYNDYRALREEFWTEFETALAELHDPIQTDDPWAATVEVLLAGYDALPLGQTSTLSFQVSLNGSTAPGQTVTNSATVTYGSR